MNAYAVALLRQVRMGPDIVNYLKAIDATLSPYQGRFIIHGGRQEALEGGFAGDLIVIAFPDRVSARAWYESSEYQEILPLRRANAEGDAFLIDGVDAAHRATDVLPSDAQQQPEATSGSVSS